MFGCCVVGIDFWSIVGRFWCRKSTLNKSIKNRSQMPSKTRCNLGWIWDGSRSRLLDRFLNDLGPKLGAKLGPSWHQNRKKNGDKAMSTNQAKTRVPSRPEPAQAGPRRRMRHAPQLRLRRPRPAAAPRRRTRGPAPACRRPARTLPPTSARRPARTPPQSWTCEPHICEVCATVPAATTGVRHLIRISIDPGALVPQGRCHIQGCSC